MKYLPLLTWWLLGRPLLSKCTQWKVMLWCQTCPPWQVQCEQWTDLWEQKLRMGEVCYERKRCVTTPDCLEGKVTHTNLYFESLFQFFFPPNYINSLRKSRFKMLPTILQASAPSTVVNNGMITEELWHHYIKWRLWCVYWREFLVKPMVTHPHCCFACQHLWGIFIFSRALARNHKL